MRKLSALAIAAAAIITVSGAPMTSQAAVIRVGAINTNGYMTSCNGQTGNKYHVLDQLGYGTYNGQNCNHGFECGNTQNCGKSFSQCLSSNQGCTGNKSSGRLEMPKVFMQ